MNLELLTLGGYGQFVWPAFIFTFISCYYLYLKTKEELQQQEKLYLNKFKQLRSIKIEVAKKKETSKRVLSNSSI